MKSIGKNNFYLSHFSFDSLNKSFFYLQGEKRRALQNHLLKLEPFRQILSPQTDITEL